MSQNNSEINFLTFAESEVKRTQNERETKDRLSVDDRYNYFYCVAQGVKVTERQYKIYTKLNRQQLNALSSNFIINCWILIPILEQSLESIEMQGFTLTELIKTFIKIDNLLRQKEGKYNG